MSGNETGHILSSKGLAVFYINTTMYFDVRDGQKFWQVHGSFQKYTWQTFSMSWSQENGLTAVIVGDTSNVLRDTCGKSVTPSTDAGNTFAIGRSISKSGEYAECVIRDVAVWEEEITEERMSNLHDCSQCSITPYKYICEQGKYQRKKLPCFTCALVCDTLTPPVPDQGCSQRGVLGCL